MDKYKGESFYNSVFQLYELYEATKYAIICAENFDPQRELYLAPLNQLRSALDHIFRAVANEENTENEIREVKEHMNRAGYDALEILAGNIGYSILEKMKPYRASVISAIFLDYYKVICPKITDIKINIAEIRMRPKDSETSFLYYLADIKTLLSFDKLVSSMIPSLEDFSRREKREKIFNLILKITIPLVAAAIGSLLTLIISKQ